MHEMVPARRETMISGGARAHVPRGLGMRRAPAAAALAPGARAGGSGVQRGACASLAAAAA